MWADAGLKLDSSKVLIARALKKEPDNGAFLDSYAWVLFRLGDVDSAFLFMRKAAAKINDDPIVFEHLGDILAKKGDIPAAIKAYEKCLVLEPENKAAIRERLDLLKKKN
jgi:tetratricopeptide (TPR) repeat protein